MLIASIIRKMYNPTIVHVLPLSPLESTEPYFAPPPPPTQSLATGLGIGLSPIHYMRILVSGEKKVIYTKRCEGVRVKEYLLLFFFLSFYCWRTRTDTCRSPRYVSRWSEMLLISRNWRSKGLRGIRSLRNSMSIENVWTHSENCS